jgi:threonylcarbamoyladenosine tRNA methylthiotransferase MtaB
MPATFAFYTLGCKLNFSESSQISRQLLAVGYRRVEFHEVADVYIVNTCSVTDHADRRCRKIVNEALRLNPEAYIAVIGCYAQLKPAEIASIAGVDLVLGASEKFNLPQHIANRPPKGAPVIHEGPVKEVLEYHSSWSAGDRTRSFLKVQDGCDYFCSFCTIPLARGRSRSDTIVNVRKQAEEIVAGGIREIVLTGVNTGDFGRHSGESLYKLLLALEEVEGLERLRLSSVEPNLLTDEIIHLAAASKVIMPHFHIPLQSGSDKILKMMRRRYDQAFYRDRIRLIHELIPHAAIGVDVIVGFPGETKEDFLETYRFINELPVSYLHVFTYSERPDTTAVRMGGKVRQGERFERNKMLTILSDKKKRSFYTQHEGHTYPVLWEIGNEGSEMHGFTPNYIRVAGTYDPALVNEIVPVKLGETDHENLVVRAAAVSHAVAV